MPRTLRPRGPIPNTTIGQAELFQTTGAFKVRGAFNKILSELQHARRSGVVAVSGGNHAQAVAYAGRVLGCRTVVLTHRSTPRNYLDATRGYGAEVIQLEDISEAFAKAHDYEEQGMLFVHPFDDPLVMAGQGTLGLEILEDVPGVTDVFVSIGGGGLMSGVAVAIRSQKNVRFRGVETEGADATALSLAAGHPVEIRPSSIAQTLGAPSAAPRTLAMAKEHLLSVTVVSDKEAVEALEILLERAKVLTEPAASCTLAAALRAKERFRPDCHIVLILCGGNLGVEDLCEYHAKFLER
ncbi:MAG: pyridoxal-5'-phosphate-dependent protein subunit beta [Acidobacteria bacterium]|nr:MAG: pyridoxal-5'-phosphate-dependent protein subunit beta [Acidobacteriota bacterium]